jgi:hypothetical protein
MKKTVLLALTLGVCVGLSGMAFAEKSYAPKTHASTYGKASYEQTRHTVKTMAPEFKLVKTMVGEDNFSILRPAFSKDGRYLAANLNETKSIRIWDTRTGESVVDIPSHLLYGDTQLLDGLEFTPDGQHIVVLRAGYPLKEIDWRSQTVTRTIDLGMTGSKIEDYAFCPMFRTLVLATPNGVDIWDYAKGEKITRMLSGQHINTLAFSNDGDWVVFGKKGAIQQSIGMIDMNTKMVTKYPLATLSTDEQHQLPSNYQVRHVAFEGRNHIMVGYMALTEGQYQPTGPAGVFRVDIHTGKMMGPKTLSNPMLSFDPVEMGHPFNATFINTFDFRGGRAASAADFLSPDLARVKTVTDTDLNAPMLSFRVSPDQRWMAGSFKESDGKVRVRLYEMMPSGNTNMPQDMMN